MLELSDIAYLPPSQAREKIRELGWESESIGRRLCLSPS